jgi:hypothetical protein
MKPIENPDITNEDPKYWERVLLSHGLSPNAGAVPSRKVSFIGGLNNLVGKEEEEERKATGQVIPKGHGPET